MPNKKRLLFFFVITFLDLYFVFSVFNSSLNETAIDINLSEKKFFNATIKEGWAFFTRNPREKMLNVYYVENDKLKPCVPPNGDVSNFWGISRKSRVLGFEASLVTNSIDSLSWRNLNSWDSIKDYSKTVAVKRTPLIKYLPHEIILVKTNLIPWAWALHPKRVKSTFESVKVTLY